MSKDRLTQEIDVYTEQRKDELKVIQYINEVWSKKKWDIKQSSYEHDLIGIDAIGVEKNKTKEDTRLLIQIKSESFFKLPMLQKIIYLKRISAKMSDVDSGASQRLIVTQRKGESIRIWNLSIEKFLAEPKDFVFERKKRAKKNS